MEEEEHFDGGCYKLMEEEEEEHFDGGCYKLILSMDWWSLVYLSS